MSKIYEALLRAELDRATSTPNGASGSSNGASSNGNGASSHAAALAPEPENPQTAPFDLLSEQFDPQPIHSKRLPESTPEFVPHFVPDPTAQPAGSTLTLAQLQQVRRVPWNPSLSQLPALEARGAGVEQFRSLRSRMHEFRDLNTLKSVLISSGHPQEGKSFVAANLAIAFGRHKNARVLLIDGDMRRCSLHHLLGAPLEPGLTEYLAGRASLLEVLQRPSLDTKIPIPQGLASLTFLSGGGEGENAADLSGNPRFGQLIQAVEPFFDWIVIDSSPVNLVADGVNLARACDGVLLIARGGVTRFETAQRALSELKASRILGFVLNAVHHPPATGGYYGYESYDRAQE